MECTITCFERVLHLVKELPNDNPKVLDEACDIIQNYSFQDLLNFGVEQGCFSEPQSSTLYDGIVMWEDLDGNYYEEDYDKLQELYEKMGITENVFNNFLEKQESKKEEKGDD